MSASTMFQSHTDEVCVQIHTSSSHNKANSCRQSAVATYVSVRRHQTWHLTYIMPTLGQPVLFLDPTSTYLSVQRGRNEYHFKSLSYVPTQVWFLVSRLRGALLAVGHQTCVLCVDIQSWQGQLIDDWVSTSSSLILYFTVSWVVGTIYISTVNRYFDDWKLILASSPALRWKHTRRINK